MNKYIILLPIFFLTLITCCGKCQEHNDQGNFSETSYEIFVVQEGWHTGIIFHTKDLDSAIWPEITGYKSKNFIDVGWGDEKFYQASDNLVALAARAVLWPTQSVLRIYPFSTSLNSAYSDESIILRIPVTHEQLDKLTDFVSKSYQRDENGNPQPSMIYEEADYYFLAERKYHLFRTCNTWVALAFKESGFDVRSFAVLYGKQLIRQLEDIEDVEDVG